MQKVTFTFTPSSEMPYLKGFAGLRRGGQGLWQFHRTFTPRGCVRPGTGGRMLGHGWGAHWSAVRPWRWENGERFAGNGERFAANGERFAGNGERFSPFRRKSRRVKDR